MSYLLAFENTGDTIPFDPVNQELLDFYIDQLNQKNLNNFYAKNQQLGKKILSKLQTLKKEVTEINVWLYDLIDIELELCDEDIDYLDQRTLNKLHETWVNSQSLIYDIQAKRKQFDYAGFAEQIHDMFPDDIQHPPLSAILANFNLSSIYDSINIRIHELERMFSNIRYNASSGFPLLCQNPFPKSILTNDLVNLRISFNHLGRTLYDKFLSFDTNLEFNDENSYDELLGYVTVSLDPVQTMPFSQEFISWCRLHDREPIGDNLNIGIIPNLYENLTKYRTIIFKNLLDNNRFTIQKKG